MAGRDAKRPRRTRVVTDLPGDVLGRVLDHLELAELVLGCRGCCVGWRAAVGSALGRVESCRLCDSTRLFRTHLGAPAPEQRAALHGQLRLFRGLVKLDFSCCGRVDDGAVRIAAASCPLLRTFVAHQNELLTDQAVLCLVERCPKLHKFYLSGVRHLTDHAVAALTTAPMLEKIFLIDCPGVSDASLRHLAASPTLSKIFLAGLPAVTDAGMEALATSARLRNTLRALTLGGCPGVTDHGLGLVGGAFELDEFSLRLDQASAITIAGVQNVFAVLPEHTNFEVHWN